MRVRFASLSVIGLAMIGPTMGHAGDLDRAWLRGVHVDDAGPSYRVFPPAEPYPAPPPQPYPTKSLPVRAAPPAQLSGFTFEFGSRIWYSTGKLAKDLFDDTRSSGSLNSRQTDDNLTATSFEAFGRADSPAGVFLKGFLGLGNLNHGFLDDEDFPPAIEPYSSTLSQQQGGQIRYGAVDIGQTLWRSPRASFGLFAGYGFLSESTNAFGCTQIAGNPFVCVPTIPGGVLGISEGTRWQFARLGFAGEVRLLDRLKLSGEFAWLPFEQVVANDIHWLRLGTTPFSISGPIPEFGGGTGFQAEALVSYQLTDCINLGIGARYWALETHGTTDFEGVIVDFPFTPQPQPLNFSTVRYGGFAQGSYKFGPL